MLLYNLVSYQYDDNGNTIEKFDGENTTTYGYDPENRLVTARTPEHYLEYQYDMDGIRVASAVDGVLTRYTVDKNRDYAQVLEERDADGNLIVSYVYGDDLISQNRNGVGSWYHYDGQMSTRQLVPRFAEDRFAYLPHSKRRKYRTLKSGISKISASLITSLRSKCRLLKPET